MARLSALVNTTSFTSCGVVATQAVVKAWVFLFAALFVRQEEKKACQFGNGMLCLFFYELRQQIDRQEMLLRSAASKNYRVWLPPLWLPSFGVEQEGISKMLPLPLLPFFSLLPLFLSSSLLLPLPSAGASCPPQSPVCRQHTLCLQTQEPLQPLVRQQSRCCHSWLFTSFWLILTLLHSWLIVTSSHWPQCPPLIVAAAVIVGIALWLLAALPHLRRNLSREEIGRKSLFFMVTLSEISWYRGP